MAPTRFITSIVFTVFHYNLLQLTFLSNHSSSFFRGSYFIKDPEQLEQHKDKIKLGIHSKIPSSQPYFPSSHAYIVKDWAQHGISGRGVLLDMVRFYTEDGTKPLPYDPWSTHSIPVKDLQACAMKQGVTFRTGDILILRVGFTQKWYAVSRAEREALGEKPETL